jgi:hypothetical protein
MQEQEQEQVQVQEFPKQEALEHLTRGTDEVQWQAFGTLSKDDDDEEGDE